VVRDWLHSWMTLVSEGFCWIALGCGIVWSANIVVWWVVRVRVNRWSWKWAVTWHMFETSCRRQDLLQGSTNVTWKLDQIGYERNWIHPRPDSVTWVRSSVSVVVASAEWSSSVFGGYKCWMKLCCVCGSYKCWMKLFCFWWLQVLNEDFLF
jgi:hypothetical protein